MTNQLDLFEPFADARTRQGELFAGVPAAVGLRCPVCDRHLVETESGYLSCPMAHGKLRPALVSEQPDDEDDEPVPPLPWPREARRIAKLHANRDNFEGRRWRCTCGACTRARLDGFVPREVRR